MSNRLNKVCTVLGNSEERERVMQCVRRGLSLVSSDFSLWMCQWEAIGNSYENDAVRGEQTQKECLAFHTDRALSSNLSKDTSK